MSKAALVALAVVVSLLAAASTGTGGVIRPGPHPFALNGQGNQPDVAFGPDGTAHVVWNELVKNGPDVLHYCRIPSGARTCASSRAIVPPGPDDPSGSNHDAAGPRVLVTGPHQVVLLTEREISPMTVDRLGTWTPKNCTADCLTSGYRIWEYVSDDGGVTFGTPHIVSHQLLEQGAVTALQVDHQPYVGIFGPGGSTSFGFEAPPLHGYIRQPAGLTSTARHVAQGVVTALHDDTPVVAWTDATQALSKIYLRRYGGTGDRNDAASWSAPVEAGDGTEPQVAAAGKGPVYLLYRRARAGLPGSGQFFLRRYDGHTIHVVGTVTSDPSVDEGSLAVDDGGGVHVAWVVRNSTANRDEVRYRYAANGSTFNDPVELAQGTYQGVWHLRLAAGTGSAGLVVFSNKEYGNGTVTAARVGVSEPETTPLDVAVAGMEVTQAIQTEAVSTRPPGGSSAVDYIGVPLAKDKKTVVRVWATASSDLPGGLRALGLPTTPVVSLRAFVGAAELPGGPLLPEYQPAKLPVHEPTSVSRDERTSPTSAYEFTLPWQWTEAGRISLVAEINPPGLSPSVAECRTCLGNNTLTVADVKFFPTTRMQVFPLRLTINSNDKQYPDDPTPIFSGESAVMPFPVDVMPWQATVDVSDAAKLSDQDAREEALDDTEDWADANDTLSSHLIAGVVIGNMGIGSISIGGGVLYSSTQPITVVENDRPLAAVAHELGHAIGRVHADLTCGGNSNGQTGEAWPPNNDGALDGVGLDTRGSAPYPVIASSTSAHPGLYYDFMSYCPNQDAPHWISVRNWERAIAFRAPRNAPIQRPPVQHDPAASPGAAPTVFVRAMLDSTGAAAVRSVVPDSGSPTPDAGNGFTLVARDAGGHAVASAGLVPEVLHIDRGPRVVELTGKVSAANAASVAIVQDGKTIATRAASKHAPVVSVLAPTNAVQAGGGVLHVRWHSSDADGDKLDAWVEYSADGGRSWRTLEVGRSSGDAVVPATLVTSSQDARIRVRVQDGFHETVATSARFVSRGAPPTVQLLAPAGGTKLLAGAAISLDGRAFDGLRQLPASALTWLDGARVLGHGERLTAPGLAPGRHTLTLAAHAGGGTGKSSVVVVVAPQRPQFRVLVPPKSASASAGSVVIRAAATFPATLQVGTAHFSIDTQPRSFAVRVKPGHGALQLRLALVSGRTRSDVTVTVQRR